MTDVNASLPPPEPVVDADASVLPSETMEPPRPRRPGRPCGSKKLKIAIPKDPNETNDGSQHIMRLRDSDRSSVGAIASSPYVNPTAKRPVVQLTEEVPKKRPRGRPPLSSKHKKHLNHTPVSSVPAPTKFAEVFPLSVPMTPAASPAPPRSNTNYLYEDLTPRVLAVLMLSAPLSAEELHRSVTSPPYILGSSHHFSLEHVQTAAEVLTLTGVVMKVVSSSSSNSAAKLYAIKHFARCREAIDIKDLSSNIIAQEQEAQATRKRVVALEELHASNVSPSEKLKKLREFIASSMAEDASLADSSVYQAMCKALDIKL